MAVGEYECRQEVPFREVHPHFAHSGFQLAKSAVHLAKSALYLVKSAAHLANRGPLIRKAFELYASGSYTLDRLTETMRDLELVNRSGEPLSRSQFHRLLGNPIYHGVIDFGGEKFEGAHTPIITKKLFDDVQVVIARKTKSKVPELKPYIYRGVFRCGTCDCLITAETQKGHNYLRCTKRVRRNCPERFVREEQVSEQVRQYLIRMSMEDVVADSLIAEIEQMQVAGDKSRQELTRSIRLKITESDDRLERLMQAYLDRVLTRRISSREGEDRHRKAGSKRQTSYCGKEPGRVVRTGNPIPEGL
jgi:hypothetical protein